ncbi:MAG: asparagine synthetase B [Myxococcales bacterium]|nr:asparagine synthetase B [Myxococcales bacterium]MCB9523853.1 asparagine synthetase B [Myxococcales bacterium]
MCGIVLLSGPNASTRIETTLSRLHHRGPDDRVVWCAGQTALGFARLAINGDAEEGRQPHQHGRLRGVVNGEIYNHRALTQAEGLPPSASDTAVVLPLVARMGPRAIDALDGFYAAVVLEEGGHEALCLRDHMGKKPLFVGRSSGEVFITSELKVLDAIEWFERLPRGAAVVDLQTGRVRAVATHRRQGPDLDLRAAFEHAVVKRVPTSPQPVGLFLSGGLDSSLVAAFASRCRDDITYFTLGDPTGPDGRAVDAVVHALGLKDVRRVSLPSPAELPGLIRAVVRATESFNPSIVSNGLATYLLAKAAHDAGIKVVLTGEGADELFGGYHSLQPHEPWRHIRERLIDDMQFTELRRLDLSCMAHSVEPRCPFLDRAVRAISDRLGYADLYHEGENKVALRRTFRGVLPAEILHRRKTSFDVGSGMRGAVVRHLRQAGGTERDALRRVWTQLFPFDASAPHFSAYPTFDAAIDRRGEGHR